MISILHYCQNFLGLLPGLFHPHITLRESRSIYSDNNSVGNTQNTLEILRYVDNDSILRIFIGRRYCVTYNITPGYSFSTENRVTLHI